MSRLGSQRLVAALFLIASTGYVFAQTAGTGGISGTITDPTGAVVPQVSVSVTQIETGQSRFVATEGNGTYRVSLLPPGTYRIKFTATGFKALEVPSVTVSVTEVTIADETLQLGSQAEQVTVDAAVATLQTESSTVGAVIGAHDVSTLPLTNRNYTQILTLAAGVAGSVTNAAVLGRGTQDISVNGGMYDQNNYQQDGIEINNYGTGNATDNSSFYGGIAVPNPDSLEEFKVQTSLYDAGYGRNPGANVNVVTKSGANAFHGGVWEFLRNTDLNANDFFQNRNGLPRAPFLQNQFGGIMGGRIKKDKIFFFGSYQGTRQVNGLATQGHSTVDLPPLTNDRSAATLGAKFCPQNNPTSKTFFAETVQVACDGSNINPVALAILNAKVAGGGYYIPTPQTILPNGIGFSSYSLPAHFTEDQVMFNTDFVITSKNTLSERFFFSRDDPTLTFSANGQTPGNAYSQFYGNENYLLRDTSILTNNLVNEARISLVRIPAHSHTGEALTSPQVGMTPIQTSFDYLPVITVQGLFSAGGSSVDTYTQNTNQYQWSDQLSWTHGRHTIRTGFQAERVQWNWDYIGSARGSLTFESFADFLLGQSAQTNGSALGIGNIYAAAGSLYPPSGSIEGLRANTFSSFVQDDIKVNPRLTVNLGVRWEFHGLMSDKYGNQTNVWESLLLTQPVPPAGGSLVGYTVPSNFTGVVPNGVYQHDNTLQVPNGRQPVTNFGPRAGFAWQPLSSGHLVVRGGYGYFYDRISGNYFINGIVYISVPYIAGEGGTGVAEGQGTFQAPFNPFNNFGWTNRTANFATNQSSNLIAGTVQETMPTPLVQEYNLNLQYELPSRMLLEVGYTGSHGIHLQDKRQINQPNLASTANPVNGLTPNTTQNAVLRVPFVGFSPVGLQQVQDNADTRYNALTASLKKSLSHGVQFGAAYTFSKNTTDLFAVGDLGGFA